MNLSDNKLFSEQAFTWILSLERKRTNRSRRPFLLLLLELMILPQHRQKQRHKLVNNILQSLKHCTRQTDIIGWYKDNVVLGVIFTELSQDELAIDKIQKKVIAALQDILTPEQADMLIASFHVYPPKGNDSQGSSINEKLFPDLKRKNVSSLCKRIIDILASLCLSLLCSPLIVLVCMAIKLTSKGPILFKQTRIGQFGRPFTCFKFRSMYLNTDSKTHEKYVTEFILWNQRGDSESDALKQDGLFKMNEDARVTPVGRFLRKSSLDELPQLLNVFVGSMSLVGPRPPVLYEVECYDTWHMRRVYEARPGITGLWQVKGRSRTTFDDMVRLDLQYVDAWSIWTDIKILLQTPWAVLSCKGAR